MSILKSALEIYTQYYGEPSEPLELIIRGSGGEVRLSVPVSAPCRLDPSKSQFSPGESEILRVLGSATIQGKNIAKRLGRPGNSSLRVLLANLVERGILARTPDGYRKSDMPTPPADTNRPTDL